MVDQDYRPVPFSPKARFALGQLNCAPGIDQLHPFPVSEQARQAAGVNLLTLHAQPFTPDGDVLTDAIDLLHRGRITDGGFVTVFERLNGLINIPPGHEVFSIYNAHVGKILETTT